MYLWSTELFEIELTICIKMDLAVITNKGWYAIKPKPNQTKLEYVIPYDSVQIIFIG